MNRSYFPLVSCFALVLLVFLLRFCTDLSQNVIISIALIMVFFIIFSFVLKTEGQTALNVAVIIFSFIFLPLFVVWYLGIFSLVPWPWGSLLLAVGIIILGMLSIISMVKLSHVEIEIGE